MPTQALIPQQNGTWQGWNSIVGSQQFAYQAVSDTSDASYLVLGSLVPPLGRISFPVLIMAAGQNPSFIQVIVRGQRNAGVNVTIQVGFSRGGAFAFDGTIDTLTSGIGNAAHNFATNPITGMPWAQSDLNGLEICVQREPFTGGAARIMRISGTLTYAIPLMVDVGSDRQGAIEA